MGFRASGELNPFYKHGGSSTPLYHVWCTMKRRCYTKTDKHYQWYGARGIMICSEWLELEPFHDWALANGYKHGLTLDRIDNDGNYCPENCRWVTMKEQSNNRRSTIYYEKGGEIKTLSQWADEFGMRYKQLWEMSQREKHGLRRVN